MFFSKSASCPCKSASLGAGLILILLARAAGTLWGCDWVDVQGVALGDLTVGPVSCLSPAGAPASVVGPLGCLSPLDVDNPGSGTGGSSVHMDTWFQSDPTFWRPQSSR